MCCFLLLLFSCKFCGKRVCWWFLTKLTDNLKLEDFFEMILERPFSILCTKRLHLQNMFLIWIHMIENLAVFLALCKYVSESLLHCIMWQTTLLNHILTSNHGKRIAVIENEVWCFCFFSKTVLVWFSY